VAVPCTHSDSDCRRSNEALQDGRILKFLAFLVSPANESLTRVVPAFTTLVPFTTFTAGVVYGRAVLGELFLESCSGRAAPTRGRLGCSLFLLRESAGEFNPIGMFFVALVFLRKDSF
jgi:hypothetical protein